MSIVSFVAQYRSNVVEHDGEWVEFLSGYYEMHCRENLFFAFKLCCLSLANHSSVPPHFTVTLPRLASDADEFLSSVRSIQSSLSGIPSVSGLFSNPALYSLHPSHLLVSFQAFMRLSTRTRRILRSCS